MIAVTTAAQSHDADGAAIKGGTESFQLMRCAGDRAAHFLLARLPHLAGSRVQLLAGPGNNGGDGYVIAAALERAGCIVAALGTDARTDDAKRAKALCDNVSNGVVENPHLVLDALLGTGSTGELRGSIVELLEAAKQLSYEHWAAVDVPTGLDATTGAADPRTVVADFTVTFGSWKVGALMRRDLCGELTCLDIGLPTFPADVPTAVDEEWATGALPPIGARANKGDRRRLLVVGGAKGMAGAPSLAVSGALRSGIGMVRCAVAAESVAPIQILVPEAVAHTWGANGGPADLRELGWAHAMVIGPGFGTQDARARVLAWLEPFNGPVVLDADALSAFAGATDELRRAITSHDGAVVLTPHATEAARLLGVETAAVTSDPFANARRLASATGATVLLKGIPTIVVSGDDILVVPRGTPALGTGGSGDVLSGIVGTLVAQMDNAHHAAALAALVHARAGEIVSTGRPLRGIVLKEIIEAMPHAWRMESRMHGPHVLGTLPAVGDRVR